MIRSQSDPGGSRPLARSAARQESISPPAMTAASILSANPHCPSPSSSTGSESATSSRPGERLTPSRRRRNARTGKRRKYSSSFRSTMLSSIGPSATGRNWGASTDRPLHVADTRSFEVGPVEAPRPRPHRAPPGRSSESRMAEAGDGPPVARSPPSHRPPSPCRRSRRGALRRERQAVCSGCSARRDLCT